MYKGMGEANWNEQHLHLIMKNLMITTGKPWRD